MQAILQDLKKDQNVTSKLKLRKNENKSLFYNGSHSNNYMMQGGCTNKPAELFHEIEMIDMIKKSYLNAKEIQFIDEIMFTDVNRLSKRYF